MTHAAAPADAPPSPTGKATSGDGVAAVLLTALTVRTDHIPRAGVGMEIITADVTREDLVESLLHLSRTAGRLPSHYVERRAALHVQMNLLVTELEVRGELRV